MASFANTPPDGGGLLLNDEGDAPVPLVAPVPASVEAHAGASTDAGGHSMRRIPNGLPARELQQVIDWVCSPEACIGIRRSILKASGINLGPSPRERELRRLACVLYRTIYDQTRR